MNLPKHILTTSSSTKSDRDSFTQDVLHKVSNNDNVQFHWTILSQEIDDPHDSEELLNEIVRLWVTVRGFSITASWMESYKKKEKRTVQKSTGLRKCLSGTC